MKYRLHVRYTETIRWPIWLWFILLAFTGTLAFTLWVILGNTATVIVLLILILLLIIWSEKSALRIKVSDHEITIDNSTMPLHFIRKVEKLDESEMALARTRNADPSAFLAIRFWVKPGLRLTLQDPDDPTQYWLLSTKNQEKLMSALTRNLYKPL